MTATVADNALLLEVIAGADGLDPRQYDVQTSAVHRGARPRRRRHAHRRGHRRLRPSAIASRTSTARCARRAERLRKRWARSSRRCRSRCTATRLPIWTPIALEGVTAQMMHGNGMGFNWKGLYVTSLLDAHADWRQRADELSDTLKISMLLGEYFIQQVSRPLLRQGAEPGAPAHGRLRRRAVALRSAADADMPMKATPLPAPRRAARRDHRSAAFEMLPNMRAVRRHRPSRHDHALRPGRRPAGRHDAGRQALRRDDDLPARQRLGIRRRRQVHPAVTARAERPALRRGKSVSPPGRSALVGS